MDADSETKPGRNFINHANPEDGQGRIQHDAIKHESAPLTVSVHPLAFMTIHTPGGFFNPHLLVASHALPMVCRDDSGYQRIFRVK